MDNYSQEILRRVTQNDPYMTTLSLSGISLYYDDDGQFYSDNSDDYSTFGAAIANNTHVASLTVILSDDLPLTVSEREFYDGLKSNSSIHQLTLLSCGILSGGAGQEILQAYQENNSHLTFLNITDANLQNGGDRAIGNALRSCRNLSYVALNDCNITYEHLLPIADAIRGHRLGGLYLGDNNIGNAGCDAIATLIEDPNSNLRVLHLGDNAITAEGATAIANSLANNNKLQQLLLDHNQIDLSVQDVFSNILCCTSNINSVYDSNHTLNILSFGEQQPGQQLQSLLRLNADTNKSHVAMKKILRHYPSIDMEPLFEWDAEGEQTLKALPHIINWFEGARIAVAADDEEFDIEGRKLSAIFQFAKAMPLLLEGISHTNVDNKKRKRED